VFVQKSTIRVIKASYPVAGKASKRYALHTLHTC